MHNKQLENGGCFVKKKRVIAVLLAVVLLFSSLSAVSLAFAAEADSLQAMRDKIDAAATLKDVPGVELAGAFKGLSPDDKDALGVEYVLKMYQTAYNEAAGTETEKDTAAKALLGEYTPAMKEGFVLRSYLVREMNNPLVIQWEGKEEKELLAPNTWDYNGPDGKKYSAFLDKAVELYEGASDYAKDYAAVMNNAGVIGGKEIYALARIRLMMNLYYRHMGRIQSWDAFAQEKGISPAKPTDPSATLKGDTAYEAWKAGFAGWQEIINMSSSPWFGMIFTDELAQQLVGLSKAEVLAALPAKKEEKTKKEADHTVWVKNQQEYKDYLTALAAYDKIYGEYAAYKSDSCVDMFNQIKWSAREQRAFKAAYVALDAYQLYAKDKTNAEAEKNVMDAYGAYDALPSYEKNYVIAQTLSDKFYYIDGTGKSLKEALSIVQAVKDQKSYLDFVAYVDALEFKQEKTFENNKIITEMNSRYAKLNKNLTNNFKKEYPQTYEKYTMIKSMWRYQYPTDRQGAVHQAVEGQTVALNSERNLSRIAGMLLPQANGLLSTLLGSAAGNPTAVQGAYKGVFTNDNVTFLVKTIYKFLGDLKIDGLGLSLNLLPSEVAKSLVVEAEDNNNPYKGRQFVKAKEVLAAAATWDDVTAVDWEIKNDDYDQFADAFLAALRPLTTLFTLVGLQFTNSHSIAAYDPNTATKDFVYGAYELVIIPLVETLGGQVTMTSDAYTEKVQTSGNENQDIQFKLVFDQFKPIVQKLLANPADFLAGILPNLMYHLQDGCVFDGIKQAASRLGFGIGNIDIIKNLSWESLLTLLDPLLAGAGLSIAELQLDKLASLGKGVQKPSAVANTQTVLFVEADKTSVYNHLANVLDEVLAKLGILDLGSKASAQVEYEAPKYPHNGKMDKKVVNAMVDGLDALLGGMVDFNQIINDTLCTNAMAAQAVEGIYNLIGGLDLNVLELKLNTSPDALAEALKTDDKYAELAYELDDVASWNDVALYLTNGTEVVYQADMGFKDGDRKGFMDCLVACLRPLTKALADANLLVNTLRADGTVAYGLYDLIIVPLLEDLGLTPVASETYTGNFNKLIKKQDKNQAYDYLLDTILSPVLKLVDDLTAAPANTLMKLLPNLAYQMEHGELLSLVAGIPGLAGENGKLDLAGVLNSVLKEAGVPLVLPALDLDRIASRGTKETKPSSSSLRDSYTVVAADEADVFVEMWYYLYDAVNNQDNLNQIKTLLGNIEDLDPALSGVLHNLLDDVFTAGKEESLCKLGGVLASDLWECPDTSLSGDKTPSTGDNAAPAFVVFGMLFAAGGAIFLLRKKKAVIA